MDEQDQIERDLRYLLEMKGFFRFRKFATEIRKLQFYLNMLVQNFLFSLCRLGQGTKLLIIKKLLTNQQLLSLLRVYSEKTTNFEQSDSSMRLNNTSRLYQSI